MAPISWAVVYLVVQSSTREAHLFPLKGHLWADVCVCVSSHFSRCPGRNICTLLTGWPLRQRLTRRSRAGDPGVAGELRLWSEPAVPQLFGAFMVAGVLSCFLILGLLDGFSLPVQ